MLNNEIILKQPNIAYASMLLDYCKRNKDFLTPYTPYRPLDYYTLEFQEHIILSNLEAAKNQKGYTFYIFNSSFDKIIGHISISNIVRGAFQSCFLGYDLDKDYLNKGYMTSAVRRVVEFAFSQLQLHRIEANVMPRNLASLKVLKKNNFKEEGLAKQYLKINGKWEDHIHMVIINSNL